MTPNGVSTILAAASATPAAANTRTTGTGEAPDFSRTLEQQVNAAAAQTPAESTTDGSSKGKGDADISDIKAMEESIRTALEKSKTADGAPLSAEQIAHLQQLLIQLANGQMPAKNDDVLSQVGISTGIQAEKDLQHVMTAVYNQLPDADKSTMQGAGDLQPALRTTSTADNVSRGGHIPAFAAGALPAEKPKKNAREPAITSADPMETTRTQRGKSEGIQPEASLRQQNGIQQTTSNAAQLQAIPHDEDSQQSGLSVSPGLRIATDAPSVAQNASPAAMQTSVPVLNQALGTPAWQQALGQQISLFTRNGLHHAELRLHPEELGALQINMRLNNDQMQLHFVSGNHQVRAAIEAAMPHLRTSLAEAGIELGNGSIGSESSSQWEGQQSGQQAQSKGEEHDTGTPLLVAEETLTQLERKAARAGGVDIFA